MSSPSPWLDESLLEEALSDMKACGIKSWDALAPENALGTAQGGGVTEFSSFEAAQGRGGAGRAEECLGSAGESFSVERRKSPSGGGAQGMGASVRNRPRGSGRSGKNESVMSAHAVSSPASAPGRVHKSHSPQNTLSSAQQRQIKLGRVAKFLHFADNDLSAQLDCEGVKPVSVPLLRARELSWDQHTLWGKELIGPPNTEDATGSDLPPPSINSDRCSLGSAAKDGAILLELPESGGGLDASQVVSSVRFIDSSFASSLDRNRKPRELFSTENDLSDVVNCLPVGNLCCTASQSLKRVLAPQPAGLYFRGGGAVLPAHEKDSETSDVARALEKVAYKCADDKEEFDGRWAVGRGAVFRSRKYMHRDLLAGQEGPVTERVLSDQGSLCMRGLRGGAAQSNVVYMPLGCMLESQDNFGGSGIGFKPSCGGEESHHDEESEKKGPFSSNESSHNTIAQELFSQAPRPCARILSLDMMITPKHAEEAHDSAIRISRKQMPLTGLFKKLFQNEIDPNIGALQSAEPIRLSHTQGDLEDDESKVCLGELRTLMDGGGIVDACESVREEVEEMFDISQDAEASPSREQRTDGQRGGGDDDDEEIEEHEDDAAGPTVTHTLGLAESQEIEEAVVRDGEIVEKETEGLAGGILDIASTCGTLEDDLDSFMLSRGIKSSGQVGPQDSTAAHGARIQEITVSREHRESGEKQVTKVRLEILKESSLAKCVYQLRCLAAAILMMLEERNVVKSHSSVTEDYLLAISDNIRSQVSASRCTISTAKLVMTWSALMSAYVVLKLTDQLIKSGPVVALAFLASACEDPKWRKVLVSVLGAARDIITESLQNLCDEHCTTSHPYWPALRSKVEAVASSHTEDESITICVLVKSSLVFESVSKALYGLKIVTRYFKAGDSFLFSQALTQTGVEDRKLPAVLVLTEQCLIESNTALLPSATVMIYFLPPGEGAKIVVDAFPNKVTRLEIVEPRIEPGLVVMGAAQYKKDITVDVSTERLWIDSEEMLCGGAMLHRSVPIKAFANSCMFQRRELLLLLEEENISLIERPCMRPEIQCGNTCILIAEAGELSAVNVGKDFESGCNAALMSILELSPAYSQIWLVVEHSARDGDTPTEMDAKDWVKLHGVASSLGVSVHVRSTFNQRQLAVMIRAAIESSCALDNSDKAVAGPESYCLRETLVQYVGREHLDEEESADERMLVTFPSLNPTSAQAVMRCLSDNKMTIEDLVRLIPDDARLQALLMPLLSAKVFEGLRASCIHLHQQPYRPRSPSPSPEPDDEDMRVQSDAASAPTCTNTRTTMPSMRTSSRDMMMGALGGVGGGRGDREGGEGGRGEEGDWVVYEYIPSAGVVADGFSDADDADDEFLTRSERDALVQSGRKRKLTVVRSQGSSQTRLAWKESLDQTHSQNDSSQWKESLQQRHAPRDSAQIALRRKLTQMQQPTSAPQSNMHAETYDRGGFPPVRETFSAGMYANTRFDSGMASRFDTDPSTVARELEMYDLDPENSYGYERYDAGAVQDDMGTSLGFNTLEGLDTGPMQQRYHTGAGPLQESYESDAGQFEDEQSFGHAQRLEDVHEFVGRRSTQKKPISKATTRAASPSASRDTGTKFSFTDPRSAPRSCAKFSFECPTPRFASPVDESEAGFLHDGIVGSSQEMHSRGSPPFVMHERGESPSSRINARPARGNSPPAVYDERGLPPFQTRYEGMYGEEFGEGRGMDARTGQSFNSQGGDFPSRWHSQDDFQVLQAAKERLEDISHGTIRSSTSYRQRSDASYAAGKWGQQAGMEERTFVPVAATSKFGRDVQQRVKKTMQAQWGGPKQGSRTGYR